MRLNKEQKIQLVKDLSNQIKQAKSVLIIGYKGTKNSSLIDLRKKLKQNQIKMKVIKNTLLSRAFKRAGFKLDAENFGVPLSLVFSLEDEIMPAKIVSEAQKETETLAPLAGIFEGQIVDAQYIAELAKLPAREELQAKLVGVIKGPIARMQNALKYNLISLITVLKNKQ